GRPFLGVTAAAVGGVEPDQLRRELDRFRLGRRAHRGGSPAARYASSISRIVVAASGADVTTGAPSVIAAANACNCHAYVVSSVPLRQELSVTVSSPARVTISSPSCARMKLRTHAVPFSHATWTSARNSPSRVNADSNQPAAPLAKLSRAASDMSTSPSPVVSATA